MRSAGMSALAPAEFAWAFDYIRAHSEIWEVILSGGDPLVLSPRRLGAVIAALAEIAHVRIVRVHRHPWRIRRVADRAELSLAPCRRQ
jgi:L-lysine 2,3-aminomutase